MASAKVYASGVRTGVAGPGGSPGKRRVISGWNSATVRRHVEFLQSVDIAALEGDGYGYTLTVRDTPPSAEEWARLRRVFIERLRRAGAIRWSWNTEWQRRGTPHDHGVFYFPEGWFPPGGPIMHSSDARIRAAAVEAWIQSVWLEVAGEYGPSRGAQVVKQITGPEGWLKYLAKHASRGVSHYQRQGKPPGWSKTGRLWGKGGDWPLLEPLQLELSREEFFQFRRLVQQYLLAEARGMQDHGRVAFLRRLRKSNERWLSERRGISGWVGRETSLALAMASGWSGAVRSVPVSGVEQLG